MTSNPSYNGIGSFGKTVLRTTPKQTENDKEKETKVSTQRPTPTTPSPRGHA